MFRINVIKETTPQERKLPLSLRQLPKGFVSMRDRFDKAIRSTPHFDEQMLSLAQFRLFGRQYQSNQDVSYHFSLISVARMAPMFYTTCAMDIGEGLNVAVRNGTIEGLINFCAKYWEPKISTDIQLREKYMNLLDRKFPINEFGIIQE
jgi:hypothetical protein